MTMTDNQTKRRIQRKGKQRNETYGYREAHMGPKQSLVALQNDTLMTFLFRLDDRFGWRCRRSDGLSCVPIAIAPEGPYQSAEEAFDVVGRSGAGF